MRVASFDVGFVNMVLCVAERTADATFAIVQWQRWEIGSVHTSSTVLVELLLRRLDEDRALFDGVDVVLVERQMTTKLCTLAHAIQCYFLTRRLRGDPVPGVVIQHASRKNQCGPWLERHGRPAALQDKASYALYKKRAVEDTRSALALQPEPRWARHFEAEPKRDDLADALLHALWYLFVRQG